RGLDAGHAGAQRLQGGVARRLVGARPHARARRGRRGARALRAEMPPRISDLFEFFVALMLVGLGIRAVYQAAWQGVDGPVRHHHHGGVAHAHHSGAPHVHIGAWTLARRPLLIGAVHGLAGSGALTALVLATLPSTAAQLAYMGLFGLGSTLGMAAL